MKKRTDKLRRVSAYLLQSRMTHRGDVFHVGAWNAQEYVRARLIQFAGPFAKRLSPELSQAAVQRAAADAIASLPAAEVGRISLESRDLQLVFRHDCL